MAGVYQIEPIEGQVWKPAPRTKVLDFFPIHWVARRSLRLALPFAVGANAIEFLGKGCANAATVLPIKVAPRNLGEAKRINKVGFRGPVYRMNR